MRKEVIKLAWPIMLQNIFTIMMLLVDVIMLGWYSKTSLAAAGISGPITMTLRLILMSVPIAATAMVARAVGEQNQDKAVANAALGLLTGFIIGLAISLSGVVLARTMVGIFANPSTELYHQATAYLSITISVFVFNYLFLISTAVLRGAGDTRSALIITIFANTLNVIGDYFLIYGKAGFPEMGIRGAAISTAVSSVVECLLILWVVFGARKSALKVRLRSFYNISLAGVKTLLRISLPAAVEPLINQMGSLVFLKIVSTLGETALATHHILIRIEGFSFMPGMGLSMATAALVGQCLGAKCVEKAEATRKESLRFAFIIMGALGLLFLIFREYIIMGFTSDMEVRALGAWLLIIAALEQPLLGYAIIHQGVMRGAGDTRSPLYISVICVWLIRVPVAYLFVMVFKWGLLGAWLTMPLDWIGRSIIYTIIYNHGRWKKIVI